MKIRHNSNKMPKRRRGGSRGFIRSEFPSRDYAWLPFKRQAAGGVGAGRLFGLADGAQVNTAAFFGSTPEQAKLPENAAMLQNRRKYGFSGPGAYMGGAGAYGPLGSATRFLRRNPGVARLGMSALRAGSGFLGGGAYTNSTIPGGGAGVDEVPSFSAGGDELGSVVISHKEYICDIYGNSGTAASFTNVGWSLNPGLERTFPWLAQLAANFEEYEFMQLMFTYRSTVSNDVSSSNGQVGTVIMTTNYNANNPIFTNKSEMMQYAGSCSCKVTDDLIHGVECDPAKNSGDIGKYVRTAPVLIGQDDKTYDLGTFQLALSGTPTNFANLPIGEMWVAYTVRLRKPKLDTGLGQAISRDDFFGNQNLAWPAAPLGTSIYTGQQNSVGCLVQTGTNTIDITFPAYATGYYAVLYTMYGGIPTAASSPVIQMTYPGSTTSIVEVKDIPSPGGGVSFAYARNTGTGSSVFVGLLIHVRVSTNYGGLGNILRLTFSGTANATFTGAGLNITEYNTQSNSGSPPVFVNSLGAVVSV